MPIPSSRATKKLAVRLLGWSAVAGLVACLGAVTWSSARCRDAGGIAGADSLRLRLAGWLGREREVVVFAMAREHAEDKVHFELDPIALIRRGELQEPPEPGLERDTPASRSFADRYLRRGAAFPVFSEGTHVGTATVTRRDGPAPCGLLTANGRLHLLPGWSMKEPLLAGSSRRLGHRRLAWSTGTNSGSHGMLELARSILRQQGASDPALAHLNMPRIETAAANEHGGLLLIASLGVRDSGMDRNLFLAAESGPKGLTPRIAHYSEVHDLNDLKDSEIERFAGVLDLDDDGVDELITSVSVYDGISYRIYKKLGAEWKRIYSGGGHGC